MVSVSSLAGLDTWRDLKTKKTWASHGRQWEATPTGSAVCPAGNTDSPVAQDVKRPVLSGVTLPEALVFQAWGVPRVLAGAANSINYSKGTQFISRMRLTWELVENTNNWVLPQTYWIRKLWGSAQPPLFLTGFPVYLESLRGSELELGLPRWYQW